MRNLTIERDGHVTKRQPVSIKAQWITRVHLELERDPRKPPPLPGGARAAADFLTQADLSADVRDAVRTVLRQHPRETCWSGRCGSTIFGLATKPLPHGSNGQRASPALLDLTQTVSLRELLCAKSLLDRYAATGLTDATTLRRAVTSIAGNLEVSGQTDGVVCYKGVHDAYAVAIVTASESALTGHLLQPVELEKLQTAYRDVMHGQARDLMAGSNWRDALLLWQHLHARRLVSEQLYLDAARCFKHLDRHEDTVLVLSEAMEAFKEKGKADFFEQAGDILLDIHSQAAQSLAEKAYQAASDKLSKRISGGLLEP